MHLLVRPGGAISSPRPGCRWPPRAVTVKDGRRPSRSDFALDGHEHGGRLRWSGELCCSANDDNSEGSSPSGAKIARILVFGRSVRIGTMMQSCASRRSSEAAGPFFIAARKPWRSVGSPPPRIVIGSPASMDRQCGFHVVLLFLVSPAHRSRRRTQDDALWHLARGNETPHLQRLRRKN